MRKSMTKENGLGIKENSLADAGKVCGIKRETTQRRRRRDLEA